MKKRKKKTSKKINLKGKIKLLLKTPILLLKPLKSVNLSQARQ